MGSWFGKLLPIISFMDNCQPQQAIEPGRKALVTNDEEVNLEESYDDDVCEGEGSQGSSSRSSMEHQMQKGNICLHQRVKQNLEGKLRVS